MTDWVIGRIPVLECLRARKRAAHRLCILRGAKGIEDIRAAARGIRIEEHERRELDSLVDGLVHQGVVLEADPLPICTVKEWITRALPPDAVVVLLDGVEDPHNFGAVCRSAAACGASGVVFCKDRSAPVSPTAVKSAAGAVEYIDLVQASNLARDMEILKQAGFWLAGLDANAPQALWDARLDGRTGLVIGSEGRGIRRLIRERCDFHVRIPLSGPITSLNASVSAGIALAECMRQRWLIGSKTTGAGEDRKEAGS